MGKRIKNYQKLHNANLFVRIAAVVAFVGVAGIVTVTAFQASKEVQSMVIANGAGVPKAWEGEQVAAVNSTLSAEVLGKKYIQFTGKVTNANSGEGTSVTHLAAYLSSDGVKADGFMTLSSGNLEYTYTPNDSNSWQVATLTQPSKNADAFRLAHELHLGAAGTKTDSVYFRYYVEPENNEVATVDNKLTYLLRSDSGKTGYATSVATVAYAEAVQPAAIATTEMADSDSGASEMAVNDPEAAASAYTAPLGQSSFVPEVETVSETIASVGMNSEAFLTVGVIMMVAGVLVFAVCLAVYLPLNRY